MFLYMKDASKLPFLTSRRQGKTREISDLKSPKRKQRYFFFQKHSFILFRNYTCVCNISERVDTEGI